MGKYSLSNYATLLTIQMNIIENQQEIRTEILFVSFSIFRHVCKIENLTVFVKFGMLSKE